MADIRETAPWGTLPGDQNDPNYGRECGRCGGAIRAGLRHAHVCLQHPEDTSLRLAEAGLAQLVRDGLSWRACSNVYFSPDSTGELAAHIAHAHPKRVKLWLRCVVALRRRVAKGHALNCRLRTTRMPFSDAKRAEWVCDCGHEDDVALLTELEVADVEER